MAIFGRTSQHPFRKASRKWRRARRSSLETLESRQLLTAVLWSSGPDLPAPRTDAVALLGADQSVYVLGGDSAAATATPKMVHNTNVWTQGHNIAAPLNDLGAVPAGGDSAFTLFGGTDGTEGINESSAYVYSLGQNVDLAKMNTVRFDHGFAADSSNRAYAIGGIGTIEGGEIWASAERFDPATGWAPIAPLPVGLHGTSAIGDGNGSIFVFGGSTTLTDAGIQSTTYRYDIASDTWNVMAPMQVGTRDSAAVMDNNGAIYLIGGMSSTGATDAVQVYDPATNSWSSQTPLPEPTYSEAATVDGFGRIVIAGGFDSTNNPTSAVYRSQQLNLPDTGPTVSSSAVSNGSLDRPYTYDVNATGRPDPSYSLVAAPAGMTIDSVSGVISWQPTAGQLGVNSVTVQASNRAGSVDQTFDINVVADTIAPTTPTGLTASNITETSVDLSWNASTDAGGVDHYDIYSVRTRRMRWRRITTRTLVASVPGTATSTTLTGLTAGGSFAVQAVDTAGLKSGFSATASVTLLLAPNLSFRYGTQTAGTVQSREQTPIVIQLVSQANPAPTFSMVSGPAGIVLNPTTGLVQWTPGTADVGLQTAVFRASNSVGNADLNIDFDILPDTPKLSVQLNPTTGERFATAGVLFNAQVTDSSTFPSTFELVAAPAGMTIGAATGLISWTPTVDQARSLTQVTVRGTNMGGSTDLTFNVVTHFTGAVTGVTVTGETTQLSPTVTWTPPTGAGSDRVVGYTVRAYTRYRWGSHTYSYRSHTVDYTTLAGTESVDLTGLLPSKTYTITITPVDALGNTGVANSSATARSVPALPIVRYSINSASGVIVAGQPMDIVLTDNNVDPSTMDLVSGPAGLTFDPATNTAHWTPSAADVTTGYATTDVLFRATNSVGPIDVTVPIRVLFSGAVGNLVADRPVGTYRVHATWDAPTDNINPIVGYQVTMRWTWSGRHRSRTWTTTSNATTMDFSLSPTGAVSHRGLSVAPVDASGNVGQGLSVLYTQPANNHVPVAVDDVYNATEDTPLGVTFGDGVLANDSDADPYAVMNPAPASLPSNGTLTWSSGGAFLYTPNPNFNGVDRFTYRIFDTGGPSSNVATVTIKVAAVNDAPIALDDHYAVDQDQPLVVGAAAGLLANDSDIDGDVINVSVSSQTANGTVSVNADGSFAYTPNAGFSGQDSFTYIMTDSLLNSRTAIVNIDVNPLVAGTKFFVVDFAGRSTFEYKADGSLAESYGLAGENKKPWGTAANADGSLVWVVDKDSIVYVYDDAGAQLGSWTLNGIDKPEGIATDGTNIWALDTDAGTVNYFAGAASLRSGSANATSSFSLNGGNANAKGITTDGNSLWVVDGTGAVFTYNTAGTLLGSWDIDAANSTPTGITIDPNNVNHLWIVDAGTDRIYQYDGGAARTSGAAAASASLPLATGNADPQGIADPEPLIAAKTQSNSTNSQILSAHSHVSPLFVGGPHATIDNTLHDLDDRRESLVQNQHLDELIEQLSNDLQAISQSPADLFSDYRDRIDASYADETSNATERDLLLDAVLTNLRNEEF